MLIMNIGIGEHSKGYKLFKFFLRFLDKWLFQLFVELVFLGAVTHYFEKWLSRDNSENHCIEKHFQKSESLCVQITNFAPRQIFPDTCH